jgi:hypothetical protein
VVFVGQPMGKDVEVLIFGSSLRLILCWYIQGVLSFRFTHSFDWCIL